MTSQPGFCMTYQYSAEEAEHLPRPLSGPHPWLLDDCNGSIASFGPCLRYAG
jgi:hypothetical protein